jgi:hypothetical protein
MKQRITFGALLVAVIAAGAWWIASRPAAPVPGAATSAGRKILYYQSAMHPWIKSDRPGKCPICGMDLVPVYEGERGRDTGYGLTLSSNSANVINVQTAAVQRRPIVRTLRVGGTIAANSWTTAWFEFDAYERDLAWLKVGQTVEVSVPAAPGKIYQAQIKRYGVREFADPVLDPATDSTKVRAEIDDPPVKAGDLGARKLFSGLYAEGRVIVTLPETLAVPRSAVLSPGPQPVVYVDRGGNHYEPRKIRVGRIGDDDCEVLAGLQEGEKVVTSGNLLIDAELQISRGANSQTNPSHD